MTPILVFDIETVPGRRGAARVCGHRARRERRRGDRPVRVRSAAARHRATTSSRRTCTAWSRSRARCAATRRVPRAGRSAAPRRTRSASSCSGSSTASRSTRRSSCPGTAAASTCRCCTTARSIHGIAALLLLGPGRRATGTSSSTTTSRASTRATSTSWTCCAGYQNRAWAPLDEIAQLCGLPGKLGMDGSQVWDAYQARRDRGDPQLLRDRRRQHLSPLPALPADPRHSPCRRLRPQR